jgi:hypothetical protein
MEVKIRSNGSLKLSVHYLHFQAFWKLIYGILGPFSVRFGTVIVYWKGLETVLIKKLKVGRGFN